LRPGQPYIGRQKGALPPSSTIVFILSRPEVSEKTRRPAAAQDPREDHQREVYVWPLVHQVVVRWTLHGTHYQEELMSIPPTNNQATITGMSIERVSGDKVVET